ncbi:hypothetical protein WA026_002014, partial [Henosepilachna vigintioctopunctata]
VYNIMSTLKLALEQRKTDCFFGFETRKMLHSLKLKSPTESDGIQKNLVLFIYKCLAHFNKWFDFDESNWLCEILGLNLKQEIQFDDCETILENLNLEAEINIDINDLYSEINIVNEIFLKVKDTKSFGNINASQKWQHISKHTDN